MELPEMTIICAAHHYIAAHESAKTETPVSFGEICVTCRYAEICRGDWLRAAAPLFEAANVHPTLIHPISD